jgi:hypothetical protein
VARQLTKIPSITFRKETENLVPEELRLTCGSRKGTVLSALALA